MSNRLVGQLAFVVPMLLVVASPARAGTLYVANNGVDGAGCGLKTSPCRSISRAISDAAPGDKIIVGPGRYTHLEETPAPGCGCMLALNKAVTLESSHGAAETWIDARGVDQNTNVLVITDGGAFGKPGKGFFVTQTRNGNEAMVLDANNVSIRGNQFMSVRPVAIGSGIEMVESPGSILFEGNQVVGWATGISMRGANKIVRRNVVAGNGLGIRSSAGSTISGNVVIGNDRGILLTAGASIVTGNAAIGNGEGITNTLGGGVFGGGAPFTGTLGKNNIFGNVAGLVTDAFGLVADDNYWGASTGPGADPADDVTNTNGATTTVTTFATSPFKVKPPIKP